MSKGGSFQGHNGQSYISRLEHISAICHYKVVFVMPESFLIASVRHGCNQTRIFSKFLDLLVFAHFFLSFRFSLVVADVTFYVGNLKSLSGLDNLDDTMDDIWDKS